MTITDRVGPFPTTIPAALRNGAERWPDRVCLDFSGEKHTFAQTERRVMQLAHGLEALGVRRGDRVCYMLDNSPDIVFVWYAVSVLGAVAVPINTGFQGEFLRHQVADSGASIFIAEGHHVERFAAIEPGVPAVTSLVLRGEPSGATTRLKPIALASLFASDDSLIASDMGESDLAMLLYTSGTTGPSKGCMIPHRYMCNMGAKTAFAGGVREGDVFWTPCPLFHMGGAGLTLGCLQLGATASIYPHFSLSKFWPEMERSGATVVNVLSAMISLIADAPDNEVSQRCHGRIRAVAGVPFTPALVEKWKRRFGVKIAGAPGFGMSEACSITLHDMELPSPDSASGQRYEDFEVEVVNDKDEILPPGSLGEVVLRPRHPHIMFQGYWNRPEATAEVFRNLWFHTGDIGRFDENGFFYWIDRKKDYLRRGGENISSFEMETTFRSHPAIHEVAVHAVFSDLGEDEVKVTAILEPGATLGEEELCRWSLDRVPHFAVPRYIEFRTDFPRTATGRIQKYQLRAQGVTPNTWDRAKSNVAVRKPVRVT